MNELFSPEVAQTIKSTIPIIFVIFIIYLSAAALYGAVKAEKLEKQSKTDSGIIARDQVRLADQQVEIESLQKQVETDQNVIDKGIVRCLQQGIEIEILDQKLLDTNERCNNLMKSKFELIKEINELYGKNATEDERNGLLNEEINTLKKSIEYYKSRANHKKRPVETVDSEWYEAKNNNYSQFKKGKIYKRSTKGAELLQNHLMMLENEKGLWLVDKSDFKPVKTST